MARVHEAHRRLMTHLALAVVVACFGQWVTGIYELLLWLTPMFMLAALLLSGRYLGEDKLLALRARRLARSVPLPRAERLRWTPAPSRAMASLLARTATQLRGPPRAALPSS